MVTRKLPPHLDELARTLPVMLTVKDVAALLRISMRTLQRLIATHQIRVVKAGAGAQGARVLITRSELLRWLVSRST